MSFYISYEVGEIMHFVFYSTSDVFRAEEILTEANVSCKVVPTPVQDKAYCGVCIETENECAESKIADMEYDVLV